MARADFLFSEVVIAEYKKPWLSVPEQIDRLSDRGVDVGDRDRATMLLKAVGYYRLTGYLYPFRNSRRRVGVDGREALSVSSDYRPGTSIAVARDLIDFDRQLRMLVLDGTERIEVSLRTTLGHVLGERSAFAHLDADTFLPTFTDLRVDTVTGDRLPSKHEDWIERVKRRQDSSDEAFVVHFRTYYDDRMPIWALTEIMELGHLSRLYGGLINPLATKIAQFYGAPSKQVMASWTASLNYVRNVAAHHARLFNRKLVVAPKRPKIGQIPALDHLREDDSAKARFGVYNALAVMAYLIRSIDPHCDWSSRVGTLIRDFPSATLIGIDVMGIPADWERHDLWL